MHIFYKTLLLTWTSNRIKNSKSMSLINDIFQTFSHLHKLWESEKYLSEKKSSYTKVYVKSFYKIIGIKLCLKYIQTYSMTKISAKFCI